MKRLLFSLGFTSMFFISYGQNLDAEILYNDGSLKKGLLEPIQSIKKNIIKYRADKKASKEKISLDNVKRITYIDGEDKIVAVPIKNKEKIVWVYVAHKGKTLTLYTTAINFNIQKGYSPTNGWFVSMPGYTYHEYFIQYKNEAPEFFGGFTQSSAPTIKIGSLHRSFRRFIVFFENKCPKLVDAYDKKELTIKDNDVYPVINYFEKFCEK